MSATIINLEVENIKRLKAVRFTPKGSTVVISGKNDQGKSSVLDAIDFAFSDGRGICEEPIRHGEKRGRVFLKLSEELNGICTIEKKFLPSGIVLEIKNADGVPQRSPQALLDAVKTNITFDPLSFVRMRAPDQMELLRKLVGLDFTELNKVRKETFDERTVRNRELESAKSKLGSLTFNPSLPKEPVSAVDIAQKLGDAKSANANNAGRRSAVKRQQQVAFDLTEDIRASDVKLASLLKMVEDTKAQIKTKSAAHLEANIEADRMTKELEVIQDLDVTTLQTEFDNIHRTNAAIESNKQYAIAQDNLAMLEGVIKGLTSKITELDSDKAAQIEFAQFPMPGLSFDEDRGVLLNGVPFNQGSQARQLQASVAIGLALNPRVKVILIRDGSLMDEDSLKQVSEQAEKANAQIWLEIVNSKDPSAIVIEDGEVKSTH